MPYLNRRSIVTILAAANITGLLILTFCLGVWWHATENSTAILTPPIVQAAAPIPDSTNPLLLAAADFESRHPSISIPAIFPQSVPFQLGLTDFPAGDKLTITEIRGTSDHFAAGNAYQITGTYNLASADQATLSVYVTARHPEDGASFSQKCQTKTVSKGQGEFTIILPMRCEGWPHVSLYANGKNIGTIYFGTADSLLKHW